MTIHWLFFATALALLFFPMETWIRGEFRMRDYESVRNDKSKGRRSWWRQPEIQLDPLRAFAGAWLIKHSWSIDPLVTGVWSLLPIVATCAICAMATIVQMHSRQYDDAFFAPIGFVAGVICALLPPQVAVLVVASSIAYMMAFRGWASFFVCGAATTAIFGYMILKRDFWMIGSVGVMATPLILSFFTGRRLFLPTRRFKGGRVKATEREVPLSAISRGGAAVAGLPSGAAKNVD